MRLALALSTLLLALTGACAESSAPSATESSLGLDGRTIRDHRSKKFEADGKVYELVRYEYGETEACDDFDLDCSYSWYCGFVVDNVDYPLEFLWVTDADRLPAVEALCRDPDDGLTCDLPGRDLAVLDDEDFETWMYETDPDDDILVDCFADYW